MPSRLQIKTHINRALRAHTVEQKLDEIALAIAELAIYLEDIEKYRSKQIVEARMAQAATGRSERQRRRRSASADETVSDAVVKV
jgi:hypothetical protein